MEKIKIEYKLSSAEKETHLNYDVDERKWHADTFVGKHMRKFIKMGWKQIREYVDTDGVAIGGTFVAAERAITFRNAEKKQMSDKQMNNLKESEK